MFEQGSGDMPGGAKAPASRAEREAAKRMAAAMSVATGEEVCPVSHCKPFCTIVMCARVSMAA